MSDKQNFDYSKLLTLLSEEEIKNVALQLASEAMSNSVTEYKEYEIKFKVPTNIIKLLEPLTEIFPIKIEDILSNMASQGLTTIIQEALKEPLKQKDTNPLDNIESMNTIAGQMSEIQDVMKQFSQMSDIFKGLPDMDKLMNTASKSEK